MEEQKNSSYQISLPLILCIGLAAGVLVGASITDKSGGPEINQDVQKLREVLGLVKNEYVDEAKTDVLVEEAISHMLGKLDPHSSYLSAQDQVAANEDLQGNFEGIGIEFNIFHDTLVVVAALSGGPSESVGLQPGDKIVKVNDNNIASVGLSYPDVQKYLKGPKGTEVKIEVIRRSSPSPITFTIIRDNSPIFSGRCLYDRLGNRLY
ncbi:MAG: carboxyl-terminal protease [Bacteroidetes bacterium OLB12]|nr:MAG: carboxyl-terminal protease [Bacteroidetes bacterium OLB12]